MKIPRLQVCIASLLLHVTAAPAVGQTSWTAPFNAFTLRIPDGWRAITIPETALNSDTKIDLIVGIPAEAGGSRLKAGCTVMHMIRPTTSGITQAAANAAIASWDEVFVASRLFGSITADVKVLEFSNSATADVQTVSMHYLMSTSPSPTEMWHSQFLIALKGKDAAFFTISCLAQESGDGVDRQRALSTFKSLGLQDRAN